MKWIKKMNELYDDTTHSLPKEEIKNIMNRQIWDKIHKGEYHKKAYIDIPFDMKDDAEGRHLDKISKLYKYEHDLKQAIPLLKYFKIVEKEEKNDFINLKYLLEKHVENVAVFSLELQVMGTWSEGKSFIFSPFIERTEKIKLDDPSFRVMNDELVDEVEVYMDVIKKEYNLDDTKEIMKKMEDYVGDLKNGNIVSYEDSDFIKPLSFFLSTKKTYRNEHVEEIEIIKKLNNNLKIYDNYTKTMFNLSVFEK